MKIEASPTNWLKLTGLFTGAVSVALGWVAVMPSSSPISLLARVFPVFAAMEYNAALGFILCGLGLLSIGFGNRRLSIAAGVAAVFCLLVVYLGYVTPTKGPTADEAPLLSEASLLVGFLMAFLPVMAVHLVHTAQSHARQLERVNLELKNEINERQRAEEHLRQSTDALARSNRDLEQFAYIASHDLKEPLRMVASYLKLLEQRYQGKLEGDAVEFIQYAVDGAKRMHHLINDLLAYSRVTIRGNPIKLNDSQAILDATLSNLKLAIEERDALVTYESLPQVMVDPTQLGQLFQNLIGNALKFCRDNPPRIHISATRKENRWLFRIQDNGIGIEPQNTERIFAVFRRLHSQSEYPGTGIGLAICKKIVERHGGRIWVESTPGEGATFYFTFPITAEDTGELASE